MNVARLNIVLAVLLFISVCLIASLDADRSQPNSEFLPNMKRSAASNAFSPNSVFPDGRTMQAPVAGTIPRGELPLYYASTKEDAIRAGEELINPWTPASGAASALQSNDSTTEQPSPPVGAIDASPAAPAAAAKPDPAARLQDSVQRGGQVYNVYCIACHGASGAGDGPVAKRGFPPPPPLPTGKSVQMRDGQLFHILTYGQGSMSSMAAQLSRDRRWDVINYVRSLQQSAADPVSPAADGPSPAERTPLDAVEVPNAATPAEPPAPENTSSDVQENQP